jgi:hypothetical protein
MMSIYNRIALGTLFYSFYNQWPLPQSFFYAVDAGMSIGFCTDVVEPNVGSRAFTVVYILLGASCVGGALVLMVQSILEEAAQRTSLRYRQILEMDSFRKEFYNENRGWVAHLQSMQNTVPDVEGALSYDDFRKALEKCGCQLTDKEFKRVCQTYDAAGKGFVQYEDFRKIFRGTDKILSTLKYTDRSAIIRLCMRVWRVISLLTRDETRIYLIFVSYILIGVVWGMTNQGWDIITATVSTWTAQTKQLTPSLN